MKILLILIIIFILFAAYVRHTENNTLFFPERTITQTPDAIELAFEDIHFQTSDGVILNGWWIKGQSQGPAPTLIFCHGNAGNIGGRLGKLAVFHRMGLNVFIFDYRGFGKSEGTPTEEGMYLDALAAYDFVQTREKVDADSIIAYGVSLGGAAAVDLAVHRTVAALIIDSSFSSAADMAKTILPFVPAFLLKTKLDSLTKIKNIAAPKLFFHSLDDQTVPFYLGKKLFDAATEPKTFIQINGTHTNGHLEDEETFKQGFLRFLKKSIPL